MQTKRRSEANVSRASFVYASATHGAKDETA